MLVKVTGIVDRGSGQALLQLQNRGAALVVGTKLVRDLLSNAHPNALFVSTERTAMGSMGSPMLVTRVGLPPVVTYKEYRSDLPRKITILSLGSDEPQTTTTFYPVPVPRPWYPRPRPPHSTPTIPLTPTQLPAMRPVANPTDRIPAPRLENPCCTSWGCVYWENAAGYSSSDNTGGPYSTNHSLKAATVKPDFVPVANPAVSGPQNYVNRSSAQTVFLGDDAADPTKITLVWQKDNMGVESVYHPTNPVWDTTPRADGMISMKDGDKSFSGIIGTLEDGLGVLIDGVLYVIINNDDKPFAKFAALNVHDGKPSGAVVMTGEAGGKPIFTKISPLGSVLTGCCTLADNVPSGCSELTADGVSYSYFADLTTQGGFTYAMFYVEVKVGDRAPRKGLVAVPRCMELQATKAEDEASGAREAQTNQDQFVNSTAGSLPRPEAMGGGSGSGGECCGIGQGRGSVGGIGGLGGRMNNPSKPRFVRYQNPCGAGCGCKPCREKWPEGDKEVRIANPCSGGCGPSCTCAECKRRWPRDESQQANPSRKFYAPKLMGR